MIQFSKLRIQGFKSFVDRTEFEIGPGLSGIVGPNGCGKSNLVEALRWVMGESSAKRMRGGGMDDVIFNGTSKRTARNIAEVTLLLDNTARKAPTAYNGSDEIEITRRIERDMGSSYKINGKNARARDVQMLFADTVTGANSPSLVSQGKVTQIINAKPLERRLILEESAGISGLFARRHEAELRLKAADGNMLRMQDVLGSMESRLAQLKREARMATRYRNTSAQIRQLEILLAWLEWSALNERMRQTQERFNMAESEVAERLTAVSQLSRTQATQSEDLPGLRMAEAEIAAELQTNRIILQRLDEEVQRAAEMLADLKAQLQQTEADHRHENQMAEETAAAMARMESEQHALIKAQEGSEEASSEKISLRNELEEKVKVIEERYSIFMQTSAELKARKQSLTQQIEQNTARMATVTTRREKARQDLAALEGVETLRAEIEQKSNDIKNFEHSLQTLNEVYEAAFSKHKSLSPIIDEARKDLRAAESRLSDLNTEIAFLETLLNEETDTAFKPVLSLLSVENGFEKALSRGFGDALLGSTDAGAPIFWERRSPQSELIKPLPQGLKPLSELVKAPEALMLALGQIGFADTKESALNARDQLLPGQAVVCADGTYSRWDGLSISAEAPDSNAVRLEQQGKLRSLKQQRPEAEAVLAACQTALQEKLADLAQSEQEQQSTQISIREQQQNLSAQNRTLSELRERLARQESEAAALKENLQLAEEDLQTLEQVLIWDQERLAACNADSSSAKEEELQALKETLLQTRESHQAAMRAYETHQQEQRSRKARLHAIADERINLQNRLIRVRERLSQLAERQNLLSGKISEMESQPISHEDEKQKLMSAISALELRRAEAAEKLHECEHAVAETTRALKQAEEALGAAREQRAGAQATMAALMEQHTEMARAIEEQFSIPPEQIPQNAAIDVEQDHGDLETLRAQKEKLTRERDQIGPVNLRADDELQALNQEIGVLLKERDELLQAIEELRGGIAKINREARERLLRAFEQVNQHFQTLFVRLFGGGQAHLALIDSDDPLGAGLEIFAQPPGKTLQSLSLLSGGEQTLASIAIIFAMFMTNPSPICVLDEIDAPLDDANVDRVCSLLEHIAQRGETRFIVVTHHRMTMARMDRLYGVTMAEKGISQLVSVDLQKSFDFLEAA